MGDAPFGNEPSGDFPQIKRANTSQSPNSGAYNDHEARRGSQHEISQPNISQGNYPYMHSYPAQQHTSQARQDPFSMNTLGNALPELSYQNYGNLPPQRFGPGSPPSALGYQMQNVPQFAGSSPSRHSPLNMPYNYPYQPQFQANYAPGHTPSPPHFQPGDGTGNQFYQTQGFMGQPQQLGSPFFVQLNQFMTQNPMYPGGGPVGQYGGRVGQNQQRGSDYPVAGAGVGSMGRSSSITSNSGPSSVARGPPRKPRQSGHAIWIGNLPPQTDLMSLVLHVCKETSGLESLFLISKSNCAFANFKDEAACTAAQAKIHDSRFQTVRLVSRLRRSSVGATAGVAVPTGPAALSPPSNPAVARSPSPESDVKSKEGDVAEHSQEDQDAMPKDKFFIMKSLTVEDLEMSVRNGIWATQSHNEGTLNEAYQAADNVYLIFSANKSGEYFGYARMNSPINDDPVAAIEFAPKAQSIEDPEIPKAIPTPATEFAPKGRIIDDSARGTIFWEVVRDEVDEVVDEEDENQSNRSDQDGSPPPSKAWGKPFQVEWISTTRLPFYRTRGLRNPWNSNREVKIARDGTELETSIGRRLLGLFHRLPSPVAAPPHMQGVPLQLMSAGHPQVRAIP